MSFLDKVIPFRAWWPLAAGALAGLTMRLVFSGDPGNPYTAMMGTFIYGAPVVIGAVTVYIAERIERRSWGYYFLAPFTGNILFVLGTLLILLEGLICAIIAMPLFAVTGGLSGLLMGLICRLTNWPNKALYSIAVLPLIFGGLETNLPSPERTTVVEKSIFIAAEPAAIWNEIHNVRHVKPDEVSHAWAYRIGVPTPVSGVTRKTPDGFVRKIEMGKGIHFDQVVTDWQENEYVHWRYRFYDDSFPPNALDKHVMIGGHYFDIEGTSYTLIPRQTGTELKISMTYRVNTQFNWYADAVARYLFGNFEEVILDFYRHRSET